MRAISCACKLLACFQALHLCAAGLADGPSGPPTRKFSIRSPGHRLPQAAASSSSGAPAAANSTATNSTNKNNSSSCVSLEQTGAGPAWEGGEPAPAPSGPVQARISQYAKPRFYTLRLKLDPNKRKFTGQLMVSLEVAPAEAGAGANSTGSDAPEPGQPQGYRYLTLHAGANLSIRKAFYVYSSRNLQIPASRLGREPDQELLTLDFHPNVIPAASQGLLLLVYTGLVNDTDSHGLFVHNRAAAAAVLAASSAAHAPPDDHLGLATQMEPGFARRLLPCWDEPQLKARFSLIVVQPFRSYQSISNMPIKRKSISLSCSGEPLQEVEFHTTPTMSTYLLALVVGKFEHIEMITANNCKIRAYFYANHSAQVVAGAGAGGGAAAGEPEVPGVNQRRAAARMALELAVRAFDRLESVLGVRYPLAKFDMVALRDFNSGAMENWGAAIFHENYMLCDNASLNANIRVNGASNRPKRLVVPLVVAHEIVHQWFGNLITSRSWSYLWLNEGFAQLLMYELAASLLPRENYYHVFLEDSRQSAMREDELITSSRALELTDDQLASQAAQMDMFDQLTYNKGAQLLRMVQHALGSAHFVAGLRHYLLKHSYDSVSSRDLWLALEESTDRLAERQLDSLMASWLALEGLPLVSVQVSESADGAHYRLALSQERFTLLPASAQQANASRAAGPTGHNQSQALAPWSAWLWSIPMGLASELEPEPEEARLQLWPLRTANGARFATSALAAQGNSILFQDKTATLLLPKASVGAWFKLNFNAIGYFRVHYETSRSARAPAELDMLARLEAPTRQQQLSAADRFNLVDDLFAMVLAGRRPLVQYLEFVWAAYEQEHELLVLRAIFDSFDRIRQALVSNGRTLRTEWLFERYVCNFVRKLIASLQLRAGRPVGAGAANAALTHRAAQQQRRQTSLTVGAGAGANGSGNNNNNNELEEEEEAGGAERQQGGEQAGARRNLAADARDHWAGAFISLNDQLKRQLKQRHKPPARSQTFTATAAAGPAQANENNFDATELLELLDSIRLTYNDAELGPSQAAAALAHHHNFRPVVPAARPDAGPFELMGRELRASIYSAALNYHFKLRHEPLAARQNLSSSLTAALPNYANEPTAARADGQPMAANASELAAAAALEEATFVRLVRLYESAEHIGALERSAIAQALGAVRNESKQALLLSLALATGPAFFRHQDASMLLDALAQSAPGRRLIWSQLNSDIQLFKQRQLLSPALRSVSRGLSELTQQEASQQQQRQQPLDTASAHGHTASNQEPQAGQQVETQLRQLYVIYGTSEHGTLIGQAIEWVRINTLWFKRDHGELVHWLEESISRTSGGATLAAATTVATDAS